MKGRLDIKFSHDYDKLPKEWENKTAILIAVSTPTKLNILKTHLKPFIEYDTKIRGSDQHYKLEGDNTEYIILVFAMKDSGHLLTTIRRYTTEKWGHYYHHQMEEFTLIKT